MVDTRIRSVVILGGGTAGWMTAAALSTVLQRTGCAVTLVESDEIGTVGVGEATIPTIHWFNQLIGLDEADFMRETKGTYKLGIRFREWTGGGSDYFHPFGTFGLPGDAQMFPHRLIRGWAAGLDAAASAFSLTAQAALAGKFAKPGASATSLLSTLGYAFHFDAGLYARYLRTLAEGRGVVRREGRVGRVEQDGETGFVAAVETDRGERVAGDLFIDCSGFRALLIEGALKTGYESWAEWLPCDGAWAAPCAAAGAFTPYTGVTAGRAGWRWRIPLQHRVGNGYVFASRFQPPEEARADLLAALESPPLAEPRLIRFTPGRRRRSWVKNVVAIGLSSGFLEPLESTSIHMIQSGIAKLLSLWPARDCDPLLAEQFERVFAREMEEVRDFLILHYRQTAGRDDPMWRACQHASPPSSLAYKLEQYRGSGRIMLASEELFRDASWFAVLTGQGVSARDHSPLIDTISGEDNLRQLRAIREAILKAAAGLSPARLP